MRDFVRPFAVVLPAVCGLVLLPICCGAFAQEPIEVDGIAAIVNGNVITISQVRALSAPREKQLRTQFTAMETAVAQLQQTSASLGSSSSSTR